jgi:pimeloyl-ACP methyl ester carboxylesterase
VKLSFSVVVAYLAIFVVIIMLVLWAHDAHLRRHIAQSYPAIGEIYEGQTARLHVLRTGKAGAQPVILIHGSSGSSRDMMQAFGTALEEDYEVLSVDRPGIGWSENKIPDIEMSDPRQQAAAIHEFVMSEQSKSKGNKKPIIVGHSWGGAVAVAYLMQFSEDIAGVLSIAPPLFPWRGPPAWYEKLVTRPVIGSIFSSLVLTKYGMTQLQAGIDSNFWPEPSRDGFGEAIGLPQILRLGPFRINSLYNIHLKRHLADMSKDYAKLTGNLTVSTGNKDRTVNAEFNSKRFFEAVPSSRLVWFEEAGHMVHYTRTQVLVDEINTLAGKTKFKPGFIEHSELVKDKLEP